MVSKNWHPEQSTQQKLAYAQGKRDQYRTLASTPGMGPQVASQASDLARSFQAASDLYAKGLAWEQGGQEQPPDNSLLGQALGIPSFLNPSPASPSPSPAPSTKPATSGSPTSSSPNS